MMISTVDHLTNNPNKIQLLKTILACNPTEQSLFTLAITAGIPYATAHRQLRALTNDGIVEVGRAGPGRKLEIKIKDGK